MTTPQPASPPALPSTRDTPVLRTDFSDREAWEAVRAAIETPNEDDFLAYVDFIEDPALGGLTPDEVLALVPEGFGHPILIVADGIALASPEMPLLVIDLVEERGRGIRVVAEELWSIENNLSISNMDFGEFAGCLDEDGIFRGF